MQISPKPFPFFFHRIEQLRLELPTVLHLQMKRRKSFRQLGCGNIRGRLMRRVGSAADFREPHESSVQGVDRGGGFMDPHLAAILMDGRVL